MPNGTEIRIKVDHKEMVIRKDMKGKVIGVKDELGHNAEEKEIKDLKLNGKTVVSISDDAVIHTHSSPGCVYYFYGGRAWRVCA